VDLLELNQLTFQDEVNHWWIKTRFLYLKKVINYIKNPHLNIREYGFGSGQNIWFMQNLTSVSRIEGVDLYWDDQIKLGFELTKANIGNKESDDLVDLIVAMDVIEHIKEDNLAIVNWKKKLKNNGHFFISVPAFMLLWSSHDDYLGHCKRYTKDEVDYLMEQTGFERLFSTYIFSPFFVLFYIIRKFKPQSNTSSDLKPINSLINYLLYCIGKVEYCCGGNPFFGTSVIGLYRAK